MCDADARDHRRIAEDAGRAGEAIEEPDAGAEENRRDVDEDFVQEPGIEALLDGVGPVDADGLPGGGGPGLVHCALEPVRHEVDSSKERARLLGKHGDAALRLAVTSAV
jgi:hypothetical protein